jgi:hypothetical protein
MANRWLSLEDRFWPKVDTGDGTGCWLWTATCWAKGYGQFCHQNRRLLAHRVAYELLVGPIPKSATLDHVKELCSSKACVKVVADEQGPAHLEPVTRGENTLRGNTLTAANLLKTHCPNGHPYDEANTYWWRGERHCRACRLARWHRTNTRTPCLRCGGPKEPGERRRLCVSCKGF